MSPPRISIIGLGKLGASMAAGMASRGLSVIGVDVNRQAVDALNAGLAPVHETELAEYIAANRDRLRATMDHSEAVLGSDISFVIVPTPSDERGAITLPYAQHAFKLLGQALKQKAGYHVFVVTSTVLPGATRHGLLPILEQESGKKCGVDFGLCYSPEFIALGTVLRDFLNPDFYLVGEFDERSGDLLERVNGWVSGAPSRRMSLENAELAKIAVNSFVTLKISYANLLSELCERIPGGDCDVVSDAVGLDRRIGRRYLTGGFGFGGPCFPRDNVALAFVGDAVGIDCGLLRENDDYNRSLSPRLVEKLESQLPPKGSTIAVLGLAYKPLSHVIEESPGIYLARALSDAGYRVLGYDPLAGPNADVALKYKALVVDSLETCLAEADAVLITTMDAQFTALSAEDFARGDRRVTVVDFWRCMSAKLAGHPMINYVPMGRCLDDAGAAVALHELWSPTPLPTTLCPPSTQSATIGIDAPATSATAPLPSAAKTTSTKSKRGNTWSSPISRVSLRLRSGRARRSWRSVAGSAPMPSISPALEPTTPPLNSAQRA